MLAVLFYGTSLFAQDKPFDIEHAPAPLFRCPIHDGPTDPTLEWNEERQEWWMFYTQRRANVPNLQEVACVYGSKVGIAATKNNGKNWYYVGTANLPEPMQGQSTFWAPLADEPPWCCPKNCGTSGHILSSRNSFLSG